MRTTKTVKVPAKTIKETVKQVTTITCDVPGCGEPIASYKYGWGKTGAKCKICDRDICRNHTVYDDDGSDYPDIFCPMCDALWRPAYREMQNRHWDEEEALRKRVKKESLNATTEK